MLIYFSQQDPRWAGKVFGTGGGPNIGQAGCAITAAGNLQIATSGNEQFTPDWMDNWLKANGGYANGDLLIWSKVPALGHVTIAGSVNSLAALNQFLAAEPNFAIVQFQVGDHLHFCLATAENTIIDSEDGRQKPLSTYHFQMAHLYTRVGAAPAAAPVPVAPAAVPSTAEGTFNVVAVVAGYVTAHNAANRLNPVSTVKPGNYHIFSQADGMVNVTAAAGTPGSWINPADNKAPAAAPVPEPANYDGNAVTIQPGWGLSNAAQAGGYPDSNSPLRWSAIAALNGSDDWQTFNSQLKSGQRIAVGKYTAPAAATAPVNPPAPTAPANITYTKLVESLNLVTKQQPTRVWQLDFASYAEARAAMDLPQGAPFVAVGKAQRTDLDHPAYFMTAEDFGTADTTGTPVNNRGINTVDLAPAPPSTVLAAGTTAPIVPEGAAAIGIKSITSDFDKRFQYAPFAEPRQYISAVLDQDIRDLRTTTNPDGGVDYPLPPQTLVPGQSVLVAGMMTVDNVQYFRTVVGTTNGSYYAIPTNDVKRAPGPSPLLKVAAAISGMFARLRNNKS